MENRAGRKDVNQCTHCHLCQKHCSFLEKYGLDIGDTDRLLPLSYHCFLCGTCKAVCPSGIDGRAVILDMRRERSEKNHGRCEEKGYLPVLAEKQNYLFRNKRHSLGASVLFPGCNFPSIYPETTKALVRLLKCEADMGVLFDCCGKPVAELGLAEQEARIIGRLNEHFHKAGVKEAVMLCPNCYYFLRDRLDVRVVSIYEKLLELGIGQQALKKAALFLPCPDREKRQWVSFFAPFLKEMPEVIEDVQCCGLGGCAVVREPELSKEMAARILKQGHEHIYTYCASCAGNLTRNGCQGVTHLLPELLGSEEKPDILKSMINRMGSKFW